VNDENVSDENVSDENVSDEFGRWIGSALA
jgi:hypothetical protein